MQRFQKIPNTHPQESERENHLAMVRSFCTIMVSRQWDVWKEKKIQRNEPRAMVEKWKILSRETEKCLYLWMFFIYNIESTQKCAHWDLRISEKKFLHFSCSWLPYRTIYWCYQNLESQNVLCILINCILQVI